MSPRSNIKPSLGPEHFYGHLIRSGGLKSIAICVGCLVIAAAVAVFLFQKLYYARNGNNNNGDSSGDSIAARRAYYDDLLGHIRGLESLRQERELLVKRALRVVQGWQHMLPTMSGPAVGSAAEQQDDERTKANRRALTIVEDLAEEVRVMRREHQLLIRSVTAALGEHDTAGILVQDKGNAVWQQAIERAAREQQQRLRKIAAEAEQHGGDVAAARKKNDDLIDRLDDDDDEEE